MSVRMRHDGIENDIEADESQVPVYERSGWVVVTDRRTALTKSRQSQSQGES